MTFYLETQLQTFFELNAFAFAWTVPSGLQRFGEENVDQLITWMLVLSCCFINNHWDKFWCYATSQAKYVSREPEKSGNIREFMEDNTARWKLDNWVIKSPCGWPVRAGKEHRYLGNQRGKDLMKSISLLKRDSPPLVTVLMAFQLGGIRFVPSIVDWSLVWWDLFDIKNKGFLLGYTGQDWWCMKSRPQRGKAGKDTILFPWEDHRFSKTCLFVNTLWKNHLCLQRRAFR